MTCKMCGMCCKALIVPISPKEAKEHVHEEYPNNNFTEEDIFKDDILFIAEVLKPLTPEQAIEINPMIKDSDFKTHYAYSCPYLTEDNKCKVHSKKLENHICKGFPWYGRTPRMRTRWYSPNCGYKIELEKIMNNFMLYGIPANF